MIPPFHFRLQPGDILFACSDGITEARNIENEEYRSARVKEVLRTATSGDARSANEAVYQHWEAFTQGARHTDDISMVSVVI